MKTDTRFFHYIQLSVFGLLCWFPFSECCSGGTLSASSGTIACPSSGGQYSNNLDVSWSIRPRGVSRIRFSKLDVEPCCDKVLIYESATSASNSSERFRLVHANATESEFWLNAPFVVRFRSDGSVTKSGFRLSYERQSESIPAATEIIRQRSGVRRSHPDVGSYRNNYKKAWSIYVPRNSRVFIRFTKFNTESGCDYLRIYSGLVPGYQHTALQAISGNHRILHPSYTFSHSVTLIFTTDGSVVREGFEFEFNVHDHELLWIFSKWTGMAIGGSKFSFSLLSMDRNVSARCYLDLECGRQTSEIAMNSTIYSQRRSAEKLYLFSGIVSDTAVCIRNITCRLRGSGMNELVESTPAPDVEPVSLEISLIKPELWSLSDGLIRFRAVSQAECRRVRHRCELRLFNGSAVTAAQVKRQASQPRISQCVSRVQTDFAVVAELIDTVNSTILCYKQAGTVNYSLPVMQLPVREIQWRFPDSAGITAGAPVRILFTTAASIRGLSAKCRLHQECGTGTIEIPMRVDRIVSTSLGKVFHFFGRWQRQVCSRNVSCAFSVPGMLDSGEFSELPPVQPTDLQLELINSELWLLNGAIQFRAVSEHACHSLRHRCELRLLNGSAVTAVQVKRQGSQPRTSQCVSRVQTDFAVVAELIDTVNSTILCYKQAGTVNYSLPVMKLPVREIQWRFPDSAGITAGAPVRILFTTAASIRGLSAKCRLHQECGTGTIEIPMRVDRIVSTSLGKVFHFFGRWQRQVCSRNVSCAFSVPGMLGSIEFSQLPPVEPNDLQLKLIDPELWLLNGAIQFRAVSEHACPSVRHRCELRTATNYSIPATLIKKDVSKPTGSRCFSSSQFLAFAQPSDVAGSTVRCRLLNGSSALLVLPELGFGETRLAGVWERPLLAASSTTAVLAIIALVAVVACFVLMRSGQWPPWKESPDAAVVNESVKMQPTVSNQYYGESAGIPDDSTGVYVT
ncbi:hypothetical protein BOX15_Mlig000815g2 [Macrostomum lignano]|uniref:CUB domain-containing protein n=1 Tax=Macrostomum lignano TaxID=282301 RepID=A0A267EJM7_9PLAT|nr:hypothetical protein BOX15_Mlig000815g2 [Macrostomum lignano]